MKILVASDSYKGSLTSMQVANCIEMGCKEIQEDVCLKKIAVADGGEGTVEAILSAMGGEKHICEVHDIFMRKTLAHMAEVSGKRFVLESASPLGLSTIKEEERNPMLASSYGLGEMIKKALDRDAQEIYIGLGGSAINDGGIGLAKALGAKLLDQRGGIVEDGARGLKALDSIQLDLFDPRVKMCKIILLSDVKNPLCGKKGATYTYGLQKGLKKEEFKEVDGWLYKYGKKLEELFGKSIVEEEGAGAAGGLGACLMAFANARMHSGIESILDMIHIEEYMKDCDVVITGEGRMDGQSIYGKAPIGIAKVAKKYHLPVIAIVGSRGSGIDKVYQEGIDVVLDCIDRPMSLQVAMEESEELVKKAAKEAMRILKMWENK